jgi:hypothetical protein
MLSKNEMKVFLAVCRAVRKKQDDDVKYGVDRCSIYTTVHIDVCYREFENNVPQALAIAMKLKEMGYLKVSKKYKYKGRYVGLTSKGVDYIKQLRKQSKR